MLVPHRLHSAVFFFDRKRRAFVKSVELLSILSPILMPQNVFLWLLATLACITQTDIPPRFRC
jgi:hypothetical protein